VRKSIAERGTVDCVAIIAVCPNDVIFGPVILKLKMLAEKAHNFRKLERGSSHNVCKTV
jgi:hypothetical protein